MIFWTHFYNLVARLLTIVLSVALAVICGVFSHIQEGVLQLLAYALCFAIVCPVYSVFLRTVADWLYCAIALRTVLSWRDAWLVGYLFAMDRHGQWMPMREVRQCSSEMRRDVLVNAARSARDTRELGLMRYFG